MLYVISNNKYHFAFYYWNFGVNPVNEITITFIGIPTVRRTKATYIFKTLDSLLNCTTDKDLSEIFVVIFLADFNNTWERETSQQSETSNENLEHTRYRPQRPYTTAKQTT
jgi:hypothetical protein